MKCLNCGVDAGRKGNRHVKFRKFTCTRTKRELQTKRTWLGRREENWIVVEDDSLDPYDCGLTDWQSTDEDTYRSSYSDSRFDSYYDKPDYDYYTSSSKEEPSKSYSRSDDYVAPSSTPSSPSSDDSWSSSSSSDAGSSWSSSSSSDSGSSWGSSSSGSSSSYDSGSSSSYDSGSSSSSSDSW